MNANEAIKIGIDMSDMISKMYLEDMTDEELMIRPDPNCNHIKWQLGHLIAADNEMVNGCLPGTLPPLPTGFKEKYSKEQSGSDDPNAFHSKSQLLELYASQRDAIRAALAKLKDEDLDKPSPESMQSYAPNTGAVFSMLGSHWVMHAGQWAVIRRQLGREPLF
jgi:hypothetical protein